MPDLAAMQKRLDPLFPGLMGVQLDEATPERVVARLPVRPDHAGVADEHHRRRWQAVRGGDWLATIILTG